MNSTQSDKKTIKRFFKRNTHNAFFKALAGFGRALNRLYENRNHDMYSNGEVTILKKIAKLNPKVIIDGGANIGSYSLLVNKLMPQTQIYAFEPVKNSFEKLKQHTIEKPNINCYKIGLYKTSCIKEINLYESNTHSSIFKIQNANKTKGKQRIALVKGDEFLIKNKIKKVDLLKIDLEGAEYDAILGFEEHIDKGLIKMIQFEYGVINITTKKLLLDYYNYFESKGYLLGKIFPKTVEFRKYEYKYEDFLGPNFIAVKETETDLIKLLSNK